MAISIEAPLAYLLMIMQPAAPIKITEVKYIQNWCANNDAGTGSSSGKKSLIIICVIPKPIIAVAKK